MAFLFSLTEIASDLRRGDLEALKEVWGRRSKLAQYSQENKLKMLSSANVIHLNVQDGSYQSQDSILPHGIGDRGLIFF